jgi:hypothetical protein
MKIITGRNVIYQNEDQSSACGCSGFDAETSDASGKKKKGGELLNKAQGIFQKGKSFLDNNQGIKNTLGNILGGNRPSNDSAPTQSYNVPDPTPVKKKMSMGVKIGIGVAAAAVIGTIIYFAVKKKK